MALLGPLMGAGLLGLVVVLSFNGGAYYAGTTGVAAAVFALGLCAWTAITRRPFAALGRPLGLAMAAFGALAGLTLASAVWSDAPARAIVEHDRALLYVLALLAFGVAGRTSGRLRWLIYGLAAGVTVVCVAGLVTRLAPDVWATERNLENERLSYPVGYWNALGLLAAIGSVLCAHLAADERGPAGVRIAGAAGLPLIAATLVLTFSRSGIAVAVGGTLVYLLLARPRGAPGALVALMPTVGYAVVATLDATLLAERDPTTPAAVAQGHELALVLAACSAAAALLRLATLQLDAVASRLLRPGRRRTAARVAGGLLVCATLGGAVAAGAVGAVQERVESFRASDPVDREGAPIRDRLSRAGGKGRTLLWSRSIDELQAEPLRGSGAGTFELVWQRTRPRGTEAVQVVGVVDGHSLYAELAGELGWPGLALLVVGLVMILVGFARLARGPDRAVGAALLAVALAWLVHAGFDWDWEVPGVTVWLFAAGGLALARPAAAVQDADRGGGLRWPIRAVVALAFAALAVLPVQVALSQRHLDRSAAAFRAEDCAEALPAARRATAVLGSRPEPRLIAAVCLIRGGESAAAVRTIAGARRRDPRNWKLHYTEGLIRATAGLDPRAAIRRSRRLNPGDPFTIQADRALSTGSRSTWRRRGPRLPLADR